MDSPIFGYAHRCKLGCQSKIKNRVTNSLDPDETGHDEPSQLDLHCLQRCLLWFTGLKGLNTHKAKESIRKTFLMPP